MANKDRNSRSETLKLAIEIAQDAKGAQIQPALDRVAEAEESAYRRQVVLCQLDLKSRGQILGFIITLLWLVGAVAIGIYSNPWAATLFGAVDLVPLVAIFVISRQPVDKKVEDPPSSRLDGNGDQPSLTTTGTTLMSGMD
jgi:hypothetical protein